MVTPSDRSPWFGRYDRGAQRLICLGWLALGCARTSQPAAESPAESPAESDEGDTKNPQAELLALDRCSERLEQIFAGPAADRPRAITESALGLSECGRLLLARCEPSSVSVEDSPVGQTKAIIDACLVRYCPQWPEPEQPAMCDSDASGFLGQPDVSTARAHATEFIAAMLAADYGGPRDEGAAQRIAGRFSMIWAAPVAAMTVVPPRFPSRPPDPLNLRVKITAKGLTLTGEGMDDITVPPGDLDELRRQATALKASHPTALQVVLTAEPDIPMQVLIEVMDTLRGDGCETDVEAVGCLFPHLAVSTE